MKYIFNLIFVCAAAGLLCSCGDVVRDDNSVAVSILPIKYLVDQISGEEFEVEVVVPSGASPETYEPTAKQMKVLSSCLVYFQVGLIDFEQSIDVGIQENAPDLPIVQLSEQLVLLEGECGHYAHHEHRHGADPHIWLSPSRVKIMAKRITEQLIDVRPDSADKYRRNCSLLVSRLDSLDSYVKCALSKTEKRPVVIYHPFLTYYCDDYGLEQVAVEKEGKEPSVSHLKKLVSLIKEQGVSVVFYQEQLHAHVVDALVQETGITGVSVDPLACDILDNIKLVTNYITNE